MNNYGLQKRIAALNNKFCIDHEPITKIERHIMLPGLRVEGEPYKPNPIPTGEVIIRELKL